MAVKKVFITVGTTKFDKLIDYITTKEILDIFHFLGFNLIQFQIGNGKLIRELTHPKIKFKYNTYYDNFEKQIIDSDLIISHAGAGTCIEVLKHKKPLIMVINEDLMDNHQTELAEELGNEGYLTFCTVACLKQVLQRSEFLNVKPYPASDSKLFSNYLDKCMGFM